jgi:2-isopropylmalate synthase
MPIHPRHPYAGDLVFTAFSGSHQDAIKKGMDRRASVLRDGADPASIPWAVPYLPIDPKDIGRSYEAIIRINSQSGKGGVAYVLKEHYGFDLPKLMRTEVGDTVNRRADELGRELEISEILELFKAEYVGRASPLKLVSLKQDAGNGHSRWSVEMEYRGKTEKFSSEAEGPIEVVASCLARLGLDKISLTDFHEHSVGGGADSVAAAYVQVRDEAGKTRWGCGTDKSIARSGVVALLCAVNRLLEG